MYIFFCERVFEFEKFERECIPFHHKEYFYMIILQDISYNLFCNNSYKALIFYIEKI